MVASGKKRGRVPWGAVAADDSDESDSVGSADQRTSSRPKKRFIWPEELHRDFIAAVFDTGLKKAEPSRLKELLPKKDRTVDHEAMKSCLQKLRSFRYQMRSALGGDNLDSPEELAQKGIAPNGALGLGMGMGMSLAHRRNGSISLPSDIFGDEDGVKINLGEMSEAFQVPKELASAMERLDNQKVKRIVELMGQCVQVQRSAHGMLMHAIDTQEVLKTAIMDKVRQMGLPLSDGGDATASEGAPSAVTGGSVAASAVAPRARPTVYVRAGAGEWTNANSGKSARDRETVGSSSADFPGKLRATSGALAGAGSDFSALATELGVGVLQSSSRITQQPPQPRVLQRTDNLFSFVSAGPSSSSSSSPPSVNLHVNSGVGVSANSSSAEASSIGPLRAATVTSVSPPPAPPPPNQATAAVSTSSRQAMPVRETSNNSSSPFDHVDWEAGVLLGGQEELDETTLRMEMKTSIDIHRLMLSRQKNQLQLHPHQEQQQKRSNQQEQKKSSSSSRGVEGSSKGKGKASDGSDANLSSTSRSPGSKAGIPSAIGQQDAAFQGAVAEYPFMSWGVGSVTASGARSATSCVVRPANAPTPAPAPPPTSEVRDSEEQVADGPESGVSTGLTSDMVAPPLMTSDWNWDEEALDAQLFSFLRDDPSSG